MRKVGARLGVALLALLITGCGSQTLYTAAKTRACFQMRGAKISNRLDFVAQTASGGAFVAILGDNFVRIAFGQTVKDAQAIVAGYERLAFPNVRAGLPDVLRAYNNAVTLWHTHPADSDLALVVGCLR